MLEFTSASFILVSSNTTSPTYQSVIDQQFTPHALLAPQLSTGLPAAVSSEVSRQLEALSEGAAAGAAARLEPRLAAAEASLLRTRGAAEAAEAHCFDAVALAQGARGAVKALGGQVEGLGRGLADARAEAALLEQRTEARLAAQQQVGSMASLVH